MTEPERNPDGASIRALAGTGEKFTMDTSEQKIAAEALLDSTPATLAEKIIANRPAAEIDLLRLMVKRRILNPAQCALLSEHIADLLSQKKLIDAQRANDRPLVIAIFAHATTAMRTRLREILLPRPEADGSLDTLV